jgi:D-sedoheptulose 7-phosphate isomerase
MNIKKLINLYKKESIEAFNSLPVQKIAEFVEMIFEAYENERTVFACGNGGNCASVQNLVVDFNMHPFTSDNKGIQNVQRNGFKCVNLCSDQATLTGITNDLGFIYVFSEQLKYQGSDGDILIGTSGSGNSKNVLEAFKTAKEKKMKNILFTRNLINNCNAFADLVISLDIKSEFPGQIGNNNANFYYEDLLSSLTHIAVGLLKEKVQNVH